jgi:ribose transport system permease protein
MPGFETFKLPIPLFLMLGLAILMGGFLHWTIYGRYLLALGRNEQAARYSGINTDRMVILAYVMCSLIAGFGGVLLALDINALQPSSFGDSWELYAIAGAVLGGCSLRGGEGSILGVVIGTALIRVLYNASSMLGISTSLEPTTIGVVILLGVMIDEIVHRISAQRQRRSA